MKINDLIKENLEKWGEIISQKGEFYIPETDGYIFPELSMIFNKLEENTKNYFEGCIVFYFYTFFHNKMKKNFGKGIDLKIHEVDFDELLNFVLVEIKETDDFHNNNKLKRIIMKFEDINNYKLPW